MDQNQCIVYILTNEAMPDYIKIGTTQKDVQKRMGELYTPGVPVPFECYCAALVEVSKNAEKNLHRAFDKYRVNKSREFFEIDPEAAAVILRMVAIKDVTPEGDTVESFDDKAAIARLTKRAANFAFNMVGIAPGTILPFKDHSTITCTVLDNRKVEFEGKKTSLTGAARIVLNRLGSNANWKGRARGPAHWMHQGQTLIDLRTERENE